MGLIQEKALDIEPDGTSALEAAEYFRALQRRILDAFAGLSADEEVTYKPWKKPEGHRLKGGGTMGLIKGSTFEKAGVNVSHVWGEFSDQARGTIPGAEASGGRFEATGISLVTHMRNPYVPTVHMNLRTMRTSKGWMGGGADLTPTFLFDEDTQDFHAAMRAACDEYRAGSYDEYKKWCDEYFYLPHRKEPRGIGGIFFDNLDGGDRDQDFAFLKSVGEAFLDVYPRIVRRRQTMDYGDEEREAQLIKRGRYVEFNLVYDRGTKFGFATDADPEAYLMSMPPLAKWV